MDMAGVEEQVSETGTAPSDTGREEIAVVNPATGAVIAHVPNLSPAEVHALAVRGRQAQPGWNALGFDGRARIFLRAQKWLIDNRERVIATIQSETGKTYEDALLAEVSYGAAAFGFWAKNAPKYLADEKIHSSNMILKGKKLVVRYKPLGLIGVIGPWNYPLTNSFGDCIPAMAAGNSVVLKPSEVTPLTSLLMGEMLRECGIPEGVYQVATGLGDTGAALVDEVDMIMFTGSTATGKKIAAKAAETLTPMSLELGGKDPLIVLSDADVERAANTAVYAGMMNGGQTCISIERVFVEEPVYDEFIGKVQEKVQALRQGVPGGPGSVDIGAMTFPKQMDIVQRHVDDAIAHGARAITGGHRREGAGDFFEPTVLVDVTPEMECMTDETFGPTLPVVKVRDQEEAIRLANQGPYGLSASVFSKDIARGEAVARRLDTGAVCVNDALVNYAALEMPMGGAKESGVGSRHGAGGIRKYTQTQSMLVSRLHGHKDPHMFPYTAKMTNRLGKVFGFLYGRGNRD
jgi:acyl-CoA reductase-like NAD-dependent aldehyde dehydrogenase